jgi:tetratricopeptide (TPR) repeat protein
MDEQEHPGEPDSSGSAPEIGNTEDSLADKQLRRSAVFAVVGVVLIVGLAVGAFAFGRVTAPDGAVVAPDAAMGDELLQEALQLHADGELEAAAELYAEVLEVDRSNKYAHYNLGVIDQFEGRFEAAIERYEAALDIDPAYGSALYNVGLAYAASGDRVSAIARLRSAAEVSSDSVGVLFNLGLLLVDAGEEEEGNNLLQRAYELDPTLEITP